MWLCRYPMPTIITYDFWNAFISRSFKKNLIKTNTGKIQVCNYVKYPSELNHRKYLPSPSEPRMYVILAK